MEDSEAALSHVPEDSGEALLSNEDIAAEANVSSHCVADKAPGMTNEGGPAAAAGGSAGMSMDSDSESLLPRRFAIRRSAKTNSAVLQPLSAEAVCAASDRVQERLRRAAPSQSAGAGDSRADASRVLSSAHAAVSFDDAAKSRARAAGRVASSDSSGGSASTESDSESGSGVDVSDSDKETATGDSDGSDGSDASGNTDGSTSSDEAESEEPDDDEDSDSEARSGPRRAGRRRASAASGSAKRRGSAATALRAKASRSAADADAHGDRIEHAVKSGLPHPDPRYSNLMPVEPNSDGCYAVAVQFKSSGRDVLTRVPQPVDHKLLAPFYTEPASSCGLSGAAAVSAVIYTPRTREAGTCDTRLWFCTRCTLISKSDRHARTHAARHTAGRAIFKFTIAPQLVKPGNVDPVRPHLMLVDQKDRECAASLGSATAPPRHLLLVPFTIDPEDGRKVAKLTYSRDRIAHAYREWCCEVCGTCTKWDRHARDHAKRCSSRTTAVSSRRPEHSVAANSSTQTGTGNISGTADMTARGGKRPRPQALGSIAVVTQVSASAAGELAACMKPPARNTKASAVAQGQQPQAKRRRRDDSVPAADDSNSLGASADSCAYSAPEACSSADGVLQFSKTAPIFASPAKPNLHAATLVKSGSTSEAADLRARIAALTAERDGLRAARDAATSRIADVQQLAAAELKIATAEAKGAIAAAQAATAEAETRAAKAEMLSLKLRTLLADAESRAAASAAACVQAQEECRRLKQEQLAPSQVAQSAATLAAAPTAGGSKPVPP